jgi:hypothetical protein
MPRIIVMVESLDAIISKKIERDYIKGIMTKIYRVLERRK